MSSTRTAGLPSVWIVDDSPLEAELVRRALAHLYDVEVFTDGAAVIEQFAGSHSPDAVVLDWRMPGISGLEVCEFLRSRPETQSIPVLMLTVQHDTRDLVECLAAGADDFLAKPCNPAELSARVGALVRSKRMHERMKSAEWAVRSLLMQLPEGVISVDPAGRIAFANLEAQRMLEAGADVLVGKAFSEVFPQMRLEPNLAAPAAPVGLPDLELGDRIFAPAIRHYEGVDATQTTLSFRDVTLERRHAQQRAELLAAERVARSQAEEASRAKDDFLAVVSHELRTPLNAILGWTRLVRSGGLDEAKRAEALETVERNALAQHRLIEDILDVSRIIAGKMSLDSELVDIAVPILASMDSVRPAAAAKSIDLSLKIVDGTQTLVHGDPSRLQQMLSNLLSNAVKFTPPSGLISVCIDNEGASARVRIHDTGRGIEPALLPYIFDRFRQADTGTSRSQTGLGLGLSIVRHLALMHGGSVDAASEGLGLGATFTLRVPLSAPVAEAAQAPLRLATPKTAPERAVSLRDVRVLVVDDDRDTRELLATTFQHLEAETLSVSSVEQALRAVGTFEPHVIVSDIGMPVQDGYALVTALRRLPPHQGGLIPAVALTAFAAPRDADRAIAAGFSAYLAKPAGADQLVALVASLARGRDDTRAL